MENIKFTTASDEPIFVKLEIYKELEQKLSSIKINDYSDNFEDLGIVFQCFPANNPTKIEERKVLRRKTKTLELYLILDYQTVKNNSDKENLQYIKQVFLQGCETFLKPMKGFEWEKFEKKINKLLN